jgi:hypothetical protein
LPIFPIEDHGIADQVVTKRSLLRVGEGFGVDEYRTAPVIRSDETVALVILPLGEPANLPHRLCIGRTVESIYRNLSERLFIFLEATGKGTLTAIVGLKRRSLLIRSDGN